MTQAPPHDHARQNRRVAVDAFVKVSGTAEGEFVFRTRDLSEGGLFLYTKVAHTYPFRVGSTLMLELYDYDHAVTCRVVVARVVEQDSQEAEQYPTGFGVRIVEIDEENAARLRTMIDQVASGDGLV